VGGLREAEAIRAEAEKLRARHATAMEEARAAAQREMHEIVRAAESEQKRLITEAREDTQRTLEDVRGRIAEEVAAARQELRADADKIAREVVRKILGREA
jgi:F-type H+-transporting ATPase subunit b